MYNVYVATKFDITCSSVVSISKEDNMLITHSHLVLPLHMPPPRRHPKSDAWCGDIKQDI
jgi:hypothetical protein